MALLGSTIQVVIAIALVIILCVIAFLVFNAEMMQAIKESGTIKRQVVVFSGVKDLAVSKNEAYNTIDPSNPTYRNIESSVNQKAGAEYTYNFWLKLDTTKPPLNANPTNTTESTPDIGLTKSGTKTPLQLQPFVLLLRGTNKAVPYKNICSTDSDAKVKMDVMVKQPMIKLEQNWDVLTIELNTQTKPDAVKEKSRNTCSSTETDWKTLNSYRVGVTDVKSKFNNKWNMVTLVVQDTFPTDPLPMRNKVRVRLYVNGALEIDRYLDGQLADTSSKATLLRPNNGNLYVAPTIKGKLGASDLTLTKELNPSTSTNAVMMADLTYFNYAVDTVQISSLFAAEFNRKYAPSMTVNTNTPISPFNVPIADITTNPQLRNL